MFAQRALQGFARLDIHAGTDAVEKFDYGDLRTQAPPHRAQFQADDAGTDHHQMFWHFGQRQRAGGIEDALVIDLDAGQGSGLGAGGDDDVLGAQLGLAARHCRSP